MPKDIRTFETERGRAVQIDKFVHHVPTTLREFRQNKQIGEAFWPSVAPSCCRGAELLDREEGRPV